MPGPSTGSGRPWPGKLRCLFGGFPCRDPPSQLPAGPSKIKKVLRTHLLNKQTNDSLSHRDPEPARPPPAVRGQDGPRGPPEHSPEQPVPLGTGASAPGAACPPLPLPRLRVLPRPLAPHLRDLQGHAAHLHTLQDHRSRLQQVQAACRLRDISRVEAGGMRVAVPVGTAAMKKDRGHWRAPGPQRD